MTEAPVLSSKLAAVSQQGFALRHSRQAFYTFDWHLHDCAMLLWPQIGGLHSAWTDGVTGRQIRLARTQAVLLPSLTAHHTRSDSQRQQHGELYLSPELLRGCQTNGALRLDGATVAMLDALVAPALRPASAEPLVRAIVAQLRAAQPIALAPPPESPAQSLLQCFGQALDQERPMPSVESVADQLGLSVRQLQRHCQQAFGCSPVSLRRHLQARHARSLLAGGDSLAAVSLRLGFASSGHLTRLLQTTLVD